MAVRERLPARLPVVETVVEGGELLGFGDREPGRGGRVAQRRVELAPHGGMTAATPHQGQATHGRVRADQARRAHEAVAQAHVFARHGAFGERQQPCQIVGVGGGGDHRQTAARYVGNRPVVLVAHAVAPRVVVGAEHHHAGRPLARPLEEELLGHVHDRLGRGAHRTAAGDQVCDERRQTRQDDGAVERGMLVDGEEFPIVADQGGLAHEAAGEREFIAAARCGQALAERCEGLGRRAGRVGRQEGFEPLGRLARRGLPGRDVRALRGTTGTGAAARG